MIRTDSVLKVELQFCLVSLLSVRDDVKVPPMASSAFRWLCAFSVCLSTGCMGAAGLQDWNYNRVNRSRAAKCFKTAYDHQQRKELGRDFELGYNRGFFDLATGRDCRVPPVAPPKYWSASYQSCNTRTCVENWFVGYQKGVVAAERCGLGDFNSIPVSAGAPSVNCSGCGACYSGDACSCNADSTVQGYVGPQG